MDNNQIIGEVLLKMIGYFEQDAMRINHALKVYGFAGAIARKEKISDKSIRQKYFKTKTGIEIIESMYM